MKLLIVSALLAIFGAAQAGKHMEVMTYGSGYNNMAEAGSDTAKETGNEGNNVSDLSALILDASNEHADTAKSLYESKAESYRSSADLFLELVREKKHTALVYSKRAKNVAALANEAYKNAQLYKRTVQDKLAAARAHNERAQKHDRMAKEQEITETDALRKDHAEHREYMNNIIRANYVTVLAYALVEMSQMELAESNDLEQQAKSMLVKADELDKTVLDLKEKAKKEKDEARMKEAKGKEEEVKSSEYEALFNEASKRVRSNEYYMHEFLVKADTERYHSEYAKIRSKYLSELAQQFRIHYETLFQFSNIEKKDADSFRRKAVELSKQSKVLSQSASEMMKRHRYMGSEVYSKQTYPYANYHES